MPLEGPRLYECMYILVPDLTEEEVQQAAADVERVIQENGGKVTGHYDWGRRTFAYKIRQWREGLYRLVYFEGDGTTVDAVKRHAIMDSRIIRAMVVIAAPDAIYKPEGEQEEAEQAQPEQQQEAEQAAEAEQSG